MSLGVKLSRSSVTLECLRTKGRPRMYRAFVIIILHFSRSFQAEFAHIYDQFLAKDVVPWASVRRFLFYPASAVWLVLKG